MEQPPNFVAYGEFSSFVCRLRKLLYGLKHTLRAWFWKFNTIILSLCFIGIMPQIQYFMRRPSTLRLTDIMHQIQYFMRRLNTWSVRIGIGIYNPTLE